MIGGRQCAGQRPQWWPEGEPWPARRDIERLKARRGRARFFRHLAISALILVFLGVCGAFGLAWLAGARLGIFAASLRGAALILLAGAVSGVTIAILVLLGVMRRVAVPLAGVMEAAERVAAGDLSVRVSETGPPPIRGLARAFNTMSHRLESHERQRRDLMADVAHELRTPLTVIQGKLEGLLDDVYPRDDDQLEELLGEARILSRLIDDLRTLALSESGALKLEKEPTDLGLLASNVAHKFQPEAGEREIRLQVEISPAIALLTIDAVRIQEVLSNLLVNALRYTPGGGSILIRVYSNGAKGVKVEVRDTGSGMTPEEIERAFERFHKGAESRGSGLGLTIARSLVIAHGGEIQAHSQPGQGTTISFSLPQDA